MGVYQLCYLRTPQHAAIHETVECAKDFGLRGVSGFLNGVLRQVAREPSFWEETSPKEINGSYLQEAWCLPAWIVDLWIQDLGFEQAQLTALQFLKESSYGVRILENKEAFKKALEKKGISYKSSLWSERALVCPRIDEIIKDSDFKGSFRIQGEISQWISETLSSLVLQKPQASVWDVCAAPGGKALSMAEALRSNDQLFLSDVNSARCELIQKNLEQYASNVKCKTELATSSELLKRKHLKGVMDLILIDAPCSSFGIAGSHPDTKWNKSRETLKSLQLKQNRLIKDLLPFLKKDGVLVYAVCSFTRFESAEVIQNIVKDSEGSVEVRLDQLEGRSSASHFVRHPLGLYALPGREYGESSAARSKPPAIEEGFFISALKRKP
jgi:16S rRNA (cytosine967-C5)-methyltransferase